jgi:hypothetical protein
MVMLFIDREKQRKEGPSLGGGIYWGSHDWLEFVDQDERSLRITVLDVSKIQLKTMFVATKKQFSIPGEEKLKRLKEAGYIRLDFWIFMAFWRNRKNRKKRFFRKEIRALIPEEWKKVKAICFDGTLLKTPYNKRVVPCLYWNPEIEKWRWILYEVNGGWYGHVNFPSAVIAVNDI